MNIRTENGWFDPETTTFGDRIAGAREKTGMTQGELAERLGVKVETLRSWEDDFSEPRANKLQTMSGLLNVSLPWLMSGEGNGPDVSAEGPEQDIEAMLVEIDEIRAQFSRSGDRLARLEQGLRKLLKDQPVE